MWKARKSNIFYSMEYRNSAANRILVIGRVSSPLDHFLVTETSVLRTNFCPEKPAHRQSEKRYIQC